MRFAHFEFDPEADRLGEGPQSEVFRAVDQKLGRTVALKILRPHVEFDPQAKERFEREAKHTSHLAHPNIATIYEYGQDRGTSYIAMEFLEGRTLDRILKDRRLGYEEGIRIALQVTEALALVHERGLIHRDLKPANVMVMADGNVKLLDFGICRSTGESNITQQGMLVGTVLYMSPEQVLGDELDVRTDIFALGSVLYHAFTGALPFPGKSFPEVCMAILEAAPEPPSKFRSGFPPPLQDFILKCLHRDPEERYPQAATAHGALMAVAESLRFSSSADRPAAVRGVILIPPLVLTPGAAGRELFAGGLRKDLRTELGRTTRLEVALPDSTALPADTHDAYILRGTLDLRGEQAIIDYTLERANSHGKSETTKIWRERIEHSDNDEWGLQAKLVSSLVRSVKRRLADFALSPSTAEARDPDQAGKLARSAHAVLQRGTSRHLMAAISTFRRALELDPHCALAHAGLAEALVGKFLRWDGDLSFLHEAREAAQRALAHDAFSAEAHTALGFAHAVSSELTEAQREYRLAIQIDHDEWRAHDLLGELLGRLGNYEGASPLLQRAIALRPDHIASYDSRFRVLRRLDRYEEAIELADRGIAAARRHLREAADDQSARLFLATLLARMGQAEEARAAIAASRERAPKDGFTCYRAAIVHAILGDADQALQMLREAQVRGYYIRSEVFGNVDLEGLRERAEYLEMMG
ncbi:MAG: serine/threonine-protein kinase [Planctomycetota bacterium]